MGRAGIVAADAKREGDGATPAGVWPLRRVWMRGDRLPTLALALPVSMITCDTGWCDDPSSEHYNRPVALPAPFSHERMHRDDHLYDLVVELGYNDAPPVPGRGSAIFLHLAQADFSPTEGCVAVDLATLLVVLSAARPGDGLEVAS